MNKKYLGLFLLMCFTWAEAQNVPVKKHEHSDEEDSINYMKEAILSEITVTGLTGTQRMKESRLKYADMNAVTGRQGISAMGRNFCIKVNIPIDIHL